MQFKRVLCKHEPYLIPLRNDKPELHMHLMAVLRYLVVKCQSRSNTGSFEGYLASMS